MDSQDTRIESIVTEYRSGAINRRVFFERLIAVVGTYKLAHHLLEQTGLAMALLSPAESDNANVDSTAVKFPGDGATLEGYLSRPKGNGPFPGIILIHENRGLNDHIRDVARRLAGQGYATLAPDLLSRLGGTASFATPDDAVKAFQNVKDDDVVRDLNSAYEYLNKNLTVKKDTIAVMGFCWGGQRSFLYATANPKLKAAVVFYGTPPSDDKMAQIHCPALSNRYEGREITPPLRLQSRRAEADGEELAESPRFISLTRPTPSSTTRIPTATTRRRPRMPGLACWRSLRKTWG